MNKNWKMDSLPTSLPLPSWMVRLRTRLDRLLSRWIPHETKEDLDWVSDADWAHIQQEPLRARFLLRWIGGVLLVLLIWAGFARIDEVTRGTGKVTPSLQLQVIQAVDPGVVSEIAVKDGQSVAQGQLLMKIDQTRFLSSLQENQSQYLALQAKAARLRAIAEGQSFELPPDIEQQVPQIVAQERALYMSKRSELDAQLSIARQQLAQRNQELNEVQARKEQATSSYQLANQELSVTKPLVSKGAVSEVELLRLQRDVARFRGDMDEASAQLVRVQASINEARHKIQDVELNFKNTTSVELAETMAKINSLSAGSAALSDRVKHSNVVSPVKGTVKRMRINTVGGVVQPGTELLEIVPTEDALLLEVRIQPKDVAFLRPGMKTMVRFTAYDFSIYGSLEGVVDHVGADTVTDDKGNSFYIVQVHTLKSSLGKDLPLLPGMQAEVDILTGKKSILSYLLKPILRAHQRAMTER
ncbi:HlyD family secretion protein [Sterolibacterium denitrificans]|uniref:Membrane fusion protein (MFP) family protein n=2 Tax=Sterolibacterium denitrificans TaxID=157592 RepID=A0A7Z7MUG5_9PROT|nr:HlyD family type I secretion periplasmic adaptor subunit [Sterolibacterium denitrificans]SMB21237.1 HlyD family secretion protein [Sterolibacterium denitrificans]